MEKLIQTDLKMWLVMGFHGSPPLVKEYVKTPPFSIKNVLPYTIEDDVVHNAIKDDITNLVPEGAQFLLVCTITYTISQIRAKNNEQLCAFFEEKIETYCKSRGLGYWFNTEYHQNGVPHHHGWIWRAKPSPLKNPDSIPKWLWTTFGDTVYAWNKLAGYDTEFVEQRFKKGRKFKPPRTTCWRSQAQYFVKDRFVKDLGVVHSQ